MSRSGRARDGENVTGGLNNVKYIAGDCLKEETFRDKLADVDAVVHAVGGLFENQAYERSL